MGRAFRVLKRTAHLTVHVAERPEKIVPVGRRDAPARRAEARARADGDEESADERGRAGQRGRSRDR